MAAIPPSLKFRAGPVEIAYLDEGAGEPVVLIHGFASNKETNWVHPGWVATLTRAGRRVIALDDRGHGESTKLYDPAAYHSERMAGDVLALLDHLGIATADLMGYSMGARIAAFGAVLHPRRVRSVILGGLGLHLVEGAGLPESIAFALEACSLDEVTDPVGRTFRQFADQTLSRAEVARIAAPVLVAVGAHDRVAGSAQALAALIPGARALDIPGRDHMLAVGDRVFKTGVLEFLAGRV
jgi:pimeloyl-ACP methyl ester carboxylesterase